MMADIYFNPNFTKLYEEVEDGEAETFVHQDEHGTISHMFIKRLIPQTEYFENYYDLVTAYGYGGPVVLDVVGDKKQLLENFGKAFEVYCEANMIVSEFIRFQPIYQNQRDFAELYEVALCRKTVATKIHEQQTVLQEFSKSTRKRIRRSFKEGASSQVYFQPTDLTTFKHLYRETMDRLGAKDFYYFSDEYFDQLLANFGSQLLVSEVLVADTVVASELCFISENVLYSHLLGYTDTLAHIEPSAVSSFALTQWSENEGLQYYFHGGGTTNQNNDTLLQYKRRFSNACEFDFYTGKKIWNEAVYDKLTCPQQAELDYFPGYRAW